MLVAPDILCGTLQRELAACCRMALVVTGDAGPVLIINRTHSDTPSCPEREHSYVVVVIAVLLL
jgi:hypothetical protein